MKVLSKRCSNSTHTATSCSIVLACTSHKLISSAGTTYGMSSKSKLMKSMPTQFCAMPP